MPLKSGNWGGEGWKGVAVFQCKPYSSILGQVFIYCGGLSYTLFSNVLGLYPLDAGSN